MHHPRHFSRSKFRLIAVAGILLGAGGWWLWQPAQPKAPKSQPMTVIADERPHKPAPPQAPPLTTIVRQPKIDQYLTAKHFSGSVLIVRDGQVVLRKGYQERDRQQHLPNTPTTAYYVGSAQKALIATAILQLQDAGKLRVDAPVATYLPAFPNGQRITLRHLLTHTSGIRGHVETSQPMTPAELLTDIQHRGIRRMPGRWQYHDSNYTVLACLVEQLSGQPLMTYLQQHIFKPAKMRHVGVAADFKALPERSVGYQIKDGQPVATNPGDLSQLFGVGDLTMPATDLYRFDHALMTGQLLSASALKTMLTAGSASTYGMGFYVNPGSYSNHGIISGWNVTNSISRSGQTYIVLMANIQNNLRSLGQVTNELYGLLNASS